ncbi:hypothetical protein Tco_0910432 [Tanacetum coccineum]|uniref:Uncharacterized protein n=1 Tax=Tanacetum coccineum TaxID=301880 RepID=A0ABQ5CUK8_9ASTR
MGRVDASLVISDGLQRQWLRGHSRDDSGVSGDGGGVLRHEVSRTSSLGDSDRMAHPGEIMPGSHMVSTGGTVSGRCGCSSLPPHPRLYPHHWHNTPEGPLLIDHHNHPIGRRNQLDPPRCHHCLLQHSSSGSDSGTYPGVSAGVTSVRKQVSGVLTAATSLGARTSKTSAPMTALPSSR